MRSFLLFQKLLEPFHPLSDLLGIVQAEERVLWGQLWELYPAKDKYKLQMTGTILQITLNMKTESICVLFLLKLSVKIQQIDLH